MLVVYGRRARHPHRAARRGGGDPGPVERGGGPPAGGARPPRHGVLQPLLREHRARERLHGVQPDPRRVRRPDARIRLVAGRALPRRARRELHDRDRPGGARQASARSPLRARRPDRDRPARRRAASPRPRGGRRRRPGPPPAGRPARRGWADGRERGPPARRVDPHRRVGPRPARGGRRAPVGILRRRGHGPVHGRCGRRGELRGPDHGPGACLPSPALTARAGDEPAALRARRGDDPARLPARLRALGA